MVRQHVVYHHGILLLFSEFQHLFDVVLFNLLYFRNEDLDPFFLELLPTQKFTVLYSDIQTKHWRISANSKFDIQLPKSELPLFICCNKSREILGDQRNKDFAEFSKLSLKFLAVEFERTVHDAAIVQRGNREIIFLEDAVDRTLWDRCFAVLTTHYTEYLYNLIGKFDINRN